MGWVALTHPTAALARGIENLVIYGQESNFAVKGVCEGTARLVSTVVFPAFLTFELVFKRISKALLSIRSEKFERRADKVMKY